MEANEMGTLPVGRLLRKMSMPLIISMFVQVLYSLVDSLYVAQLGDNALTAISLCMPVQYLVVGVGVGLGVGVNSVLSMKLGQRDGEGVNQTAGNGFLILWVVMIVFAALGFTAMTPFYEAQTDIREILDMSISYSVVLCIFSFAALHQIMMERLLSAIGRADLTMIPMLTGAVVNIILDPIMIFGWLGCPAMGITGAGIATVIGQAATAVVGRIPAQRGGDRGHCQDRRSGGTEQLPDLGQRLWDEQYLAPALRPGPRHLCGLYPPPELCHHALRRHEQRGHLHHRL